MEQLVNQMAKIPFMSGGQFRMPVTIRAQAGVGTREAAQHSQSLEGWFAHTPGLKVAMPGTVYDAKGLLKSAIRDESPVIVIENRVLFYEEEEVPEGEWIVPLGTADVARPGRDITGRCLRLCSPQGPGRSQRTGGQGRCGDHRSTHHRAA